MNRRIRLILIAAGVVVLALVVFLLLINPIRGDISTLNSEIEEEDRLIAQLEAELARALETQRDGRANQARLLELSKMIPAGPEIPSLILQIQDLADKSGIDWVQITPGQPAGAEGVSYLTLPLSLSFVGTFYDVTDFMYRAEQMVAGPGRLLTVRDVNLSVGSGSGGGSPDLDVQMTLVGFVLPETTTTPTTAAPTDTTSTTEAAQ